jgi:hypothetical protein
MITMGKKTYYVSVQAQTVFENQGDSSYEFEIQADDQQIAGLIELFEEHLMDEEDNQIRMPIPAVPYHHDIENDRYDYSLKKIYQALYDMGNPETRQHIESMNILQ